jgi:Cu+-exporting ATPase
VFELLGESGLDRYYEMGDGVRARIGNASEAYGYLDAPAVRARFVDFEEGNRTRVTFHLPEIHCVACVWLLENLFRLRPGIGQCTVHFPRKQVVIHFDPGQIRLSEVAGLLASVGYPPELRLADLDRPPANPVMRRLWLQTGVAGFAFGNTMLFSIAMYLGLDVFSGAEFRGMFGWLSLVLSVPVVAYSAQDYWKTSWRAVRQGELPIEVPIAAGIVAIWGQSVWEVLAGRGDGYFDSLAGLLFFLNIGRVFQQKTFDRLAFDRDYRSFFPLSVVRRRAGVDERVALAEVAVGDRLVVRHGELIPADARLIEGTALIDSSFVTGESEPVAKEAGQLLHAGGRQLGGAVVVETVKAVNHGYLTDLWNQETFRKDRDDRLGTLTNRYSRRFTWIILGVAVMAGLGWAPWDPMRGLKAFVSVLIVACPCALALAAPFALGSGLRLLARRNIFLRNPEVIEALAQVDSVVFDKTGTLTSADAGELSWHGAALEESEASALRALAMQTTHPLARRIAGSLRAAPVDLVGFSERAGCGVRGKRDGAEWTMGSAAWLREDGVEVPEQTTGGSRVVVAQDGKFRGEFMVGGGVRPETREMVQRLGKAGYSVSLLSGDNAREQGAFASLFGSGSVLHFGQGPGDKLKHIRAMQESGRRVLMAGDGLNDAGALRQADVGVAVVEDVASFSPASDVILRADELGRMGAVLDFSRRIVRVVRWSFLISTAYNAVGLTIAAAGWLSPVVCAVLMPLSSVSVVLAACGLAARAARAAGLGAEGSIPVQTMTTEAQSS